MDEEKCKQVMLKMGSEIKCYTYKEFDILYVRDQANTLKYNEIINDFDSSRETQRYSDDSKSNKPQPKMYLERGYCNVM